MVLTFLTLNMITKLPLPNKIKENGLNSQTKFVIKTYHIGYSLPYIASHNAHCLYVRYPY